MTSDDMWIRVEDHPPPLGELVMLSDGVNVAEGYRCAAGYRRQYGEKWEKSMNQYGATFMIVTHWQPKPKPPSKWRT